MISSINFVLFYMVAFYLIEKVGIQKTRWLWLVFICIILVVVFTYLKFRLTMYWTEQAVNNNIKAPAFFKERWHKQTHGALGLFSYQFPPCEH